MVKIIGIYGRHDELGEGKTILLTYYALGDNEKGIKCFADYTLPFAESISHVSEFSKINPDYEKHRKEVSVFLDDVIPIFDSRQSGGNIQETWVLIQCRKFGINLYFTGQMKGAIEGRLRKISNFIVETELVEFPKFRIYHISKNGIELKKPFILEYGKDVINIYNTLEPVKRKISLKYLFKLAETFKNVKGFRQITKLKFNFKYTLSDVIYLLLLSNQIDEIKELIEPYGFVLVD